jgi:hypothetical protein
LFGGERGEDFGKIFHTKTPNTQSLKQEKEELAKDRGGLLFLFGGFGEAVDDVAVRAGNVHVWVVGG